MEGDAGANRRLNPAMSLLVRSQCADMRTHPAYRPFTTEVGTTWAK
jgi:hypothetical protein